MNLLRQYLFCCRTFLIVIKSSPKFLDTTLSQSKMDDNNKRGIGAAGSSAPTYQRGKNYVLGIGIDAYGEPYKRLRNCVNDIGHVRDALLELYDFEEEHTHVLFDARATAIL